MVLAMARSVRPAACKATAIAQAAGTDAGAAVGATLGRSMIMGEGLSCLNAGLRFCRRQPNLQKVLKLEPVDDHSFDVRKFQ